MIKPLFLFTIRLGILVLLLFPMLVRSQEGAYGLLWLKIVPVDAKVDLDGQFLGTDVWLVSVSPGSHELWVRKPGFKTYTQDFEAVSGKSLHLEIRLEREAGTVP